MIDVLRILQVLDENTEEYLATHGTQNSAGDVTPLKRGQLQNWGLQFDNFVKQ